MYHVETYKYVSIKLNKTSYYSIILPQFLKTVFTLISTFDN